MSPADGDPAEPGGEEAVEADDIRELVRRLSRPHPSGGDVVERAALLASGADFHAAIDWITDHEGVPETLLAGNAAGGLHGARVDRSGAAEARVPLRFVLPAGAFG